MSELQTYLGGKYETEEILCKDRDKLQYLENIRVEGCSEYYSSVRAVIPHCPHYNITRTHSN
jgi:hypothetical protein